MDKSIETRYGTLIGVSTLDRYKNGQVKECTLDRVNQISTPVGTLIPQYENDGVRKKYINSLSFYEDGAIKSISLNEQQLIPTSFGLMSAELITFYESGKIKRIFPLNGKITGYWTEENEYALAKEQEFDFSFVNFKKKVIGIYFYETGEIKSITLWPEEKIKVDTKVCSLVLRSGFSLYLSGKLKSCEPAFPTPVKTPIGVITAYDVNASGINADMNSLVFYEDGNLKALSTTTDSIEITDGFNKTILRPGLKPSLLNENGMDILPMKIEFDKNKIIIDNGIKNIFELEKYGFNVKNNDLVIPNCSGDCSSCSACG